ncbi:hypothetical protein [Deinococcus budaensis]|uniref:Lipocalin-like domain-containing protein n=1 Tax=Deinococcus budaensis TaxID=1665626 RepID=A0A7W8GG16_9DEIO|nr:hypothetical protein [Deinococcus budaensis]MBB5234526.1 hypothetical protein [Deinococcus budaensis]
MTRMTLPLAALLTACANTDPIEVPVPSGQHVLHGTWAGTAESNDPAASPRTFPVTLTSKATYVSATEYRIEGTLSFRNVTYTLTGMAQGKDGATFRPQYTPATEPSLVWKANLSLNSEEVGTIQGYADPRGAVQHKSLLVMQGDAYTTRVDFTRR